MRATCKVSPQRQVTVPKRLWEALDRPTHFELQVTEEPKTGRPLLLMWPGRVISLASQAEHAGVPLAVLREARRIVEERKREKAEAAGRKSRP
jgi:hypothetical protein